MTNQVSWGRHNLKLRKEEYGKQIKAFLDDQMASNTLDQKADVLGVSRSTLKALNRGEYDMMTLDTLYTMAMNLEMGPSVTIPEYGSYMG